MPRISTPVSLKDIKSGFDPIPEGSYLVRVVTIQHIPTSKSGNPYLKFEFEVSEGDHTGRKLWANASLQSQALWKLRQILEAFGASFDDAGFDTDDLVGLEAIAVVGIDETMNKPINTVEELVAA